MLNIQTFDNRAGGNVLYKALAHPLAAEAIARLYERMALPVALYDPEDIAAALLTLYPQAPPFVGRYVHDITAVGDQRAGYPARALTELPESAARVVLIAAFDAGRYAARRGDAPDRSGSHPVVQPEHGEYGLRPEESERPVHVPGGEQEKRPMQPAGAVFTGRKLESGHRLVEDGRRTRS